MGRQVLPVYTIQTLKEIPVSPEDFVADRFAHYLYEHQNLHFPHKHSFYHLVYFTKGSGSHSIDFIRFPVEAGQLYFMVPGQVHTWEFETQPDGYIVNFSEPYLHALLADPRYLQQFSFFSGQASQQVIRIPEAGRAAIEQTLETIVREGQANEPRKDDFVRSALVQLFIQVSRHLDIGNHQQANSYNSLLLHNFLKLIEQHYTKKKLVKDYAALLYVTPNHLNALSKDYTGRSAGELIRDRVLLEAKRLLINARLNVSQIALELDFADNSYFSKFFKKYTGVTPEGFRKQVLKT